MPLQLPKAAGTAEVSLRWLSYFVSRARGCLSLDFQTWRPWAHETAAYIAESVREKKGSPATSREGERSPGLCLARVLAALSGQLGAPLPPLTPQRCRSLAGVLLSRLLPPAGRVCGRTSLGMSVGSVLRRRGAVWVGYNHRACYSAAVPRSSYDRRVTSSGWAEQRCQSAWIKMRMAAVALS